MKLSKLLRVLNAIQETSTDVEIRVYQRDNAPLDIDHLEIMLTDDGDVSEVWLEVVE